MTGQNDDVVIFVQEHQRKEKDGKEEGHDTSYQQSVGCVINDGSNKGQSKCTCETNDRGIYRQKRRGIRRTERRTTQFVYVDVSGRGIVVLAMTNSCILCHSEQSSSQEGTGPDVLRR